MFTCPPSQHDVEQKPEVRHSEDEEEFDEAKKLKMPVLIAKMDCVEYENYCDEQGVDGYPTLKLYVNGDTKLGGEYEGDRTILDFVQALIELEASVLGDESTAAAVKEHASAAVKKHMDMTPDHKEWLKAIERVHSHSEDGGGAGIWNPSDHPGCQLAGHLMVSRVPGRFYVQAQGNGNTRELNPRMTNLSHAINHMSFRRLDSAKHRGGWFDDPRYAAVPPNYDSNTRPFDGNLYVTYELHQSYHHYIKLISTNDYYYQVVQNSQLAIYAPDKVPEAKFVLDISPIAVRYRRERRKQWYEYVTSLLAIVGGTFTVVGMFDAAFFVISRRQTRRKSLQQMRKVAP